MVKSDIYGALLLQSFKGEMAVIEKQYGKVNLKIFDTRTEMGRVAAEEAAACMRDLLEQNAEINCIFAAAPSQSEFLEALCRQPDIAWNRVNAYHMDEYVGLPLGHEKSFNYFLGEAIFNRVPFKSVHLINGSRPAAEEAARYGGLLKNAPTHIVFMGIGENGHVAFNDPPVADFHDKETVKRVMLDPVCRRQQVHDKCFAKLEDVPKYALTVTVPRLMESWHIFCMVPSAQKHAATVAALTGPISTACPASILRCTDNVTMYIDRDCAGELAE